MNEISPPNVDSPRIGQAYVELATASNFSFLRGASHAEELVVQASRLGLGGIAITDRNSLAGVVRGHMAAKEAGLAFATGCRLVFMDGTPDILVWPEDRAAWGHLCELLTTGKRRAPKGECHLTLEDLLTHGQGLLMAVVAPAGAAGPQLEPVLRQLREAFPDHLHLALSRAHGSTDQRHMASFARLAREHDLPLVAIGDVLYHAPERRPLQDVLTCIREGRTLATIGTRLEINAERYLKSHAEMLHLFRGYEAAVAQAAILFGRIRFSLDELRYQYPDAPMFAELGPEPLPAQEALEKLTAIGLKKRYPDGAPEKVLKAIAHETQLIRKLDYAPYFLTVYDIVRFARSQGDSLPGPRLGGQFRGLLLPRHHRGRSRQGRPPVRALHLRRAATSRPISMSISSTSGARR
jgi:DNA polymerase III alpha subunit